MGAVEEGFGDGPGNIVSGLGHGLFGREHQAREPEAYRLRGRGMFLRVIAGLVRCVVVNGTVVLVMVMLDALFVLDLVLEGMDERTRACAPDRRQVALHGETIQGQAQQQEEVENPAQGYHQANVAKL